MQTQFRLAVGLLAIILVGAIGVYAGWWSLHWRVGPYFTHHWFSIIGAAYVLAFIPVYAYMKRRTSVNRGTLLKVHVFANLLAVGLVSIHFAHQMARPAEFAPALGTGLAAFILIALIVAAGFMLRFGLASAQRESWRLIHVGLGLSLYVVVIIHALINFGLL